MNKKYNALVVVRDDISSTFTWSGIPNHILKILRDNDVNVTVIDNLGFPKYFKWRMKRVINKFIKTCAPKYYSLETSKYYAELLSQRLKKVSADYDFILAIDFTEGLPFFKSDKPIFLFRDASYLQLNDISYPGYENFSEMDRIELQKIEEQSFRGCEKVLITSNWAIDFCQKYYPGISREKYHVLPFSAQVYPPPKRSDWQIRSIDQNSEIRFLFIGRDWVRKGGPKALAVLDELVKLGNRVSITIVGANPEIESRNFEITKIVNLDFSKPEESERMKNLYREAHFFILPINIEAFGIVFSEAMSFGLPVVTHGICALPEIMENNVHGVSLPYSESAGRFALILSEIINSPERYKLMQEECFKRFEGRFHPKLWVDGLLSLVQ